MSSRNVPVVKRVVLLAATVFLVLAAQVQAGDRYHTVTRPAQPRSQPPPAPVFRPAVETSVTVEVPAQPATEPVYADLRGPDGQVRRFLVEGGREAIQYRQVTLRPGESVTIRLAAK